MYTILSKKELPKLKKLKQKYGVFRVIEEQEKKDLEEIEIITNYGVFKGYGRTRDEAFKKAKKSLKRFHKKGKK